MSVIRVCLVLSLLVACNASAVETDDLYDEDISKDGLIENVDGTYLLHLYVDTCFRAKGLLTIEYDDSERETTKPGQVFLTGQWSLDGEEGNTKLRGEYDKTTQLLTLSFGYTDSSYSLAGLMVEPVGRPDNAASLVVSGRWTYSGFAASEAGAFEAKRFD